MAEASPSPKPGNPADGPETSSTGSAPAPSAPSAVQGTAAGSNADPAALPPLAAPAWEPITSPAPTATSPPAPPSPGAPSPGPPQSDPLARLPLWTVPAVLVGIVLLALAASAISPTFEQEIVWRYYWGPIKADALGYGTGTPVYDCPQPRVSCENTVAAFSGYNIVNTLSWAALLGLCLLGAAQMLRRFNTVMDNRLVIGATAWVVAGSVFHVLEDSGLIQPPLQYFFITPPIYLLFAAFGILSFLVGQYLKAVAARVGTDRALHKLWLLLCAPVLGYLFLWLDKWPGIVVYVNPAWVALFAAISFFAVRWQTRKAGRIDPTGMVLSLSIGWNLLALAYVVLYLQSPWSTPRGADHSAVYMAPLLAGAVAGVVYLIGHMLQRRPGGSAYGLALMQPINLLVVFSQLVDGFATALGIDFNGYEEKHVLSAKVIDVTRDFSSSIGWHLGATYPTLIGFVPLKLAVSLVFIYIIDVSSKSKLGSDGAHVGPPDNPTMIGLVKFAIIMVGLGPGIRDFVRLGLGV